MTHEEADHRLAAGWHVDLEEADALCSAQRKRYIRQEQERLNYAFLHSSTTGNPVLGERNPVFCRPLFLPRLLSLLVFTFNIWSS